MPIDSLAIIKKTPPGSFPSFPALRRGGAKEEGVFYLCDLYFKALNQISSHFINIGSNISRRSYIKQRV